MNRRQKIIVSVTGIFIVLLALVGLTYAYFLTRIQGNTNDKSISVTTVNLALVYRDGSPELITSDEPIVPGKFESSKTFTVTNEGNASIDSYGLYLEDFSVTYANDGVDINNNAVTKSQATKLDSPTDMKMVITCKSVNAKTGVETGSCDGVDGTLPTGNETLLTSSIDVGIRHEYTLTLTYLETGVDQSADMNKTISGKIQIYNEQDVVNVEGTVTGSNAGDYVQINSVQKISQIVDGKYVLAGVEPGTHILQVFNKNGVLRGSTTLTINKGNENNISGTTITINDRAEVATANITEIKSDKTLSINIENNIKEASLFKKGTLAYNIINNAMKNAENDELLSGTKFVTTPTSIPGQEPTTVDSVSISRDLEVNLTKWYVGDSKSEDETNPVTSTLATTCTEDMIGKYMYAFYTDYTATDMEWHVIGTDGVYGPILGCSNGKPVLSYSNSYPRFEQELGMTEDDYGISYYYRGAVVDNYMNYSGMCWRIVRIQGDGKIKLILENQNDVCKLNVNNKSAIIEGTAYAIDYENSSTPTYLENWMKEKAFDTSKLSETEWCNDMAIENEDIQDYSSEGGPIFTTSYMARSNGLKCDAIGINGSTAKKVKSNIAILTLAEVEYAGGVSSISYNDLNVNYYLGDVEFGTLTPYCKSNSIGDNSYRTLYFSDKGYLAYDYYIDGHSLRPAIVLQENLAVTGDGTINSPYEVK